MIIALLFLISVVLAVPTFGISLVAFFLAKILWDRACAEQIAKHVFLSIRNGGTIYKLQRINGAAIRGFFNKLGTKVPRYTFDASLGTYIGVVHLRDIGDISASVVLDGKYVCVSASEPPPEISVEGVLDGSFDKSFEQWIDKQMPSTRQRSVPAAATERNETHEDDIPF